MQLFRDINNPKLTDKEIDNAFITIERNHLKELFKQLDREDAEDIAFKINAEDEDEQNSYYN